MRYSFVLLMTAWAALAQQDFATGQAARLVIGQRTFTDQIPGAAADLLGGVGGVAYANDTLFVCDSNRVGSTPQNNRVLVFSNLSGQLPQPSDELLFTRDCPVCLGQATLVLGQPDFSKTDTALTRTGMRTPTAVASDGRYLAVADTDNNRILIWNSIPTSTNQQPDLVLGQPDFTSGGIPPRNTPTASSLRGPQGVWIQNGRLYIADTQNHRVVIHNSMPTSNNKPGDVVLGQPNFTTFVEPDLTQAPLDAKATNMLNPVSVTSDGVRLFVTDLGHNRVLVWNSIPTQNAQAADLALGQPDMISATENNSSKLCASNGTDTSGNATYPPSCLSTLSFPRFSLADGKRLFIADGGNDRILIYNRIPATSGEAADYVVGQLGGGINQASDSTDSMRTPLSLAWDGNTNLYVSDSFNRRVLVYSIGEHNVPYSGVRNAASVDIYAIGTITFGGTLTENDSVTINLKVADADAKDYVYKIVKDDTFDNVVNQLVTLINAGDGDSHARAYPILSLQQILLVARAPGADGNAVNLTLTTAAATTSGTATITTTTSGSTLTGGQDAAKIGPGTVVSVIGDGLSERTEAAPDPSTINHLPDTLADTQVYFDGIRAPLFFVSPGQINAQVPWEVRDRTSISAYVRTKLADGRIRVTTPVAVTIVKQNPGIFTSPGNEPRPAVMFHGSANATGTVSVDGAAFAGDLAAVRIEDREYRYTVVEGDTLASIRDALVALINASPDEKVIAIPSTSFTRIRLRAKVPGPEGQGIPYLAFANEGAQVVMTAISSALCCANTGRVTSENPAIPGETILVYATGLGLPQPRVEVTGIAYDGPLTEPQEFVSSLAGGKTANVLGATLAKGQVGVFEVLLELNSDIPTNPVTQLTIAQDIFVSNIVSFPVVNPNPPIVAQ